jgi:hypothetical protein
MFVKANARRYLKPLLKELSDWRDTTRVHAANLLKTTIVFLEEHITVHLHKLVGTLCRCAKGLSEEWSKEVTGLVARFVPTDSLIDLVLPIVREDPDGAKGVSISGPGSRGRSLIVLCEILKVIKRARLETHAREIGMALGNIEKANTRDPVERRSLLLCMTEYGKMFCGHASFMNGSTGRLVTLNNTVQTMMQCVDISAKLLAHDIKLGTVGAKEAALLCDSAKQALSAVLIDPALKRQQEESKKTGEGSQEDRNIVSSVLGSVKVDERTVDLDSDGEGMEDFDVE